MRCSCVPPFLCRLTNRPYSVCRITNTTLLIALGFFFGGFALINRFGAFLVVPHAHPFRYNDASAAPDPVQFGEHTITQKHLYTGLFVIGIPLLWLSSPIGTVFWLVGASSILILSHASLMEPGIESEYASVQDAV